MTDILSSVTKNWPWNPNSWILPFDVTWDSKTPTGFNHTWISPDGMVEISPTGVFLIKKGFKWDGCTGVPDIAADDGKGRHRDIDPITGYPYTWKASLIHDVVCDYYRTPGFPYTRHQGDKFFYALLKESHFKLAWLYYFGVSIFGFIKTHTIG